MLIWWHTIDTVFEIFRLSIFLLISILKLKSAFFNVFSFKPYPSDPKSNTFLPSQLWLVKSFFAWTSKALTQKLFFFNKFNAVFKLETLKISIEWQSIENISVSSITIAEAPASIASLT